MTGKRSENLVEVPRLCRLARDPHSHERDKLHLNAEMAVRFAIALEVSTDELLGLHNGN